MSNEPSTQRFATKLTMSHVSAPPNSDQAGTGPYVRIDGEECYKIVNSHLMPEFFVSMVSSSDHFMFISSSGALTAGRRNPESALFPYYSSDKIVDLASCTGPKPIIRIASAARYVAR